MRICSVLLIIVFSLTTNIFPQKFTPHTITTSADGANSVYAVDLDGDGDMDVLSASGNDDKIAWYENDGNGNFITHTITTNANGAESVFAVDVDGDGDIDVLSSSQLDNRIAWYENNGDENFIAHTITTNADGAISVYAVDVDGDGDIDVLSASENDNNIVWYENLSIVNSVANSNEIPIEFRLSQNYPNPFNPSTKIKFQNADAKFVSLKVYDVLGREVATLVNEEKPVGIYEVKFDAVGLPSGIYFYRLQAGSFIETKKMIFLK